ncbi:hypothetical protein NADFUDRAFT_83147 [Nadsonia fulvescens var. elongata DSM 6958]|uniref:Uncharacterized protein n=1 Tax=Nadsonia fulvescens var. elongata DSM 6958 TaxID=857566 RepID=A0A1E3PI05_9ASCO|nr:hypothetical protein NADFUDRAFT_83147 [Nadsonia fulvescens var. elongata DSM 6958]
MKLSNSVLLAGLASAIIVNAGVVPVYSNVQSLVNDLSARSDYRFQFSSLGTAATVNVLDKLIAEAKSNSKADITKIIAKVQQRGTYISEQIKELIDEVIRDVPYKDIALYLEQIKSFLSEVFGKFPGGTSAWKNSTSAITSFPALSSIISSTHEIKFTTTDIFYTPTHTKVITPTKVLPTKTTTSKKALSTKTTTFENTVPTKPVTTKKAVTLTKTTSSTKVSSSAECHHTKPGHHGNPGHHDWPGNNKNPGHNHHDYNDYDYDHDYHVSDDYSY